MNSIWLIKSEEEADEGFGKRPEERTIEEAVRSSVVVMDKHAGPTSHQITAWIRNIFGVRKAGHTGTLDPGVTGVLPVALENATKVMPLLMGLNKEYVGVMHIHKEVPEKLVRETVLKFIGRIRQMPPVRSAVARRLREREVYFLDILEIEGKDVLFRVGCEAGTYVRVLCHQIGQTLGTGAHLTELRRTKVGNLTEEDSHSLLSVKDAFEIWKEKKEEKLLRGILVPIEHTILHVKRVFVKDSAIPSIVSGAPVFVSGIARIQEDIDRGETVAVYSPKGELVAFGTARMDSGEMYAKKEGTAVRTDRVLIRKENIGIISENRTLSRN